MKAADLFAKCLENEGVEYIFAVPGEENLTLLESIRKTNIRVIVNRHEQASAFMAATYGRLTGKPGVCLATLGPGATNLITGVAHAQLGGMPLMAITGQKAIRENWQATFQVIDVVDIMKPVTKRSVQIKGPKSIPKEIRSSFMVATTERQGAAHIELPEDVASEKVGSMFSPHEAVKLRRPIAEKKGIKIAAEMIRNARHPIIIISSRAQRNLVKQNLRKFCDQTNIYAVHTQLGKGVLSDDHKNSLFAFGIHKKDYVNCAIDRSDLLITVGYSITEYPPSIWNPKLDKKILHIDFTPAEPDIYYPPQFELIGDIGTSFALLAEELKGYRFEDDSYIRKLKRKLEKKLFEEGAGDDAFPMRPRRIIADVRKALGKDDILVLDNGIYKMWFSRHYRTYDIGTFLVDNALAAMGGGIPIALAAKLVHPHKKVLAVVGDGGFMMSVQELETAVRLGLNVAILVLKDDGYGFIKWKQKSMGYKDFALDFGNPNFVKLAESFGAKGVRIKKASELLPALRDALSGNSPVVIECPVDYSENEKMWNGELGSIRC